MGTFSSVFCLLTFEDCFPLSAYSSTTLQRPTKEEKRFFFFIICWPRISPFFMGGKVDERFVVGWILAVRHVTVKRSGSG